MKIFSLHRAFILAAFGALLTGTAMAAQLNTNSNLNTHSTLTDVPPPQTIPDPNPSPAFDTVIDDLPLMPGLSVVPQEDVLFVVPHRGRIAETKTEGMVDVDDVYGFYEKTLPQLGWQRLDVRTYKRDKDILRIDAHAEEKITTVRFFVNPAEQQ